MVKQMLPLLWVVIMVCSKDTTPRKFWPFTKTALPIPENYFTIGIVDDVTLLFHKEEIVYWQRYAGS